MKESFNVKGTTHLTIGDPWYFEEGRKDVIDSLCFDGNISASPLGYVEISNDNEYDQIDVNIYQAATKEVLDTYRQGRYFPLQVKAEKDLGCDTARFAVVTKFASDEFRTGADGYYGHITVCKQHYGMLLNLSFDSDLFTFEEIKKRILRLWPERKEASHD